MNQNPYELYPEDAPPEETMFASSLNEMTGLIPAGRPDKDERDSYQDVLPWLPPFAAPQI
ncbi:MAG: hypothetical protein K2I93_07035 [Oscillospiraceae bacterium]|nr:hypothetical protein [Oscillospiraceae bacterium]